MFKRKCKLKIMMTCSEKIWNDIDTCIGNEECCKNYKKCKKCPFFKSNIKHKYIYDYFHYDEELDYYYFEFGDIIVDELLIIDVINSKYKQTEEILYDKLKSCILTNVKNCKKEHCDYCPYSKYEIQYGTKEYFDFCFENKCACDNDY